MKREASYQAGELNGVDKVYCSGGKLRSETGYAMGQKDGVDRTYDCETGKITLEQHYEGGELHGKSLSYLERMRLNGRCIKGAGKTENIPLFSSTEPFVKPAISKTGEKVASG